MGIRHDRKCETALILEGGGMRGAFTAGVLDLFLDYKVEFPYTIGVSAGATNAISYIAKQRGRTLYADTTLVKEHPYIGVRQFIKNGEMVDMDLLFGEFAHTIYPVDLEAYVANHNEFEIVTSDIVNGAPCYFSKPDSFDRLSLVSRASCSLPIINHIVDIDGTAMLDGGLTDSIPLARAFELGYQKAVVVLTQCRGFRKKEHKMRLPKWICPKYPKVAELLNSRTQRYNAQLEWIEKLESEGQIIVLRPKSLMNVGRLTTNPQHITALYNHGYKIAEEWLLEQLE